MSNPAPATATISSIQVGQPRELRRGERTFISSIAKQRVNGPIEVLSEHLAGDGQADRRHHGGADKAINVYPEEHYRFWSAKLGPELAKAGAFGENLTLAGQTEATACIGDIFHIGSVIVQVSQPRQPCATLAKFWQVKDFVAQVRACGRTGWYLRVLRTGPIQAGQELVLEERPYPQWTIAEANRIMFDHSNKTEAASLHDCPALSDSWQQQLAARF